MRLSFYKTHSVVTTIIIITTATILRKTGVSIKYFKWCHVRHVSNQRAKKCMHWSANATAFAGYTKCMVLCMMCSCLTMCMSDMRRMGVNGYTTL